LCSRSSNSDTTAELGWLIVGRVGKPHGVHGDLLVDIMTDFPDRLVEDVEFGVGDETGPVAFHRVFRVRLHKGRWLLSVSGIRDRSAVEDWRGRFLFLPEQPLADLPEGYYYEHHLVGLTCVDRSGDSLGTVTGLDTDGGQIRLNVRIGRREHQIPYVPEIVLEVDLDRSRIVVDPPRGLLDDNAIIAN
jgi:16S rRNA processing protein RimM